MYTVSHSLSYEQRVSDSFVLENSRRPKEKGKGCVVRVLSRNFFFFCVVTAEACFLFWAAAPKGPMTYASTQTGNFSCFLFIFSVQPLLLRLKSQPHRSNSSLIALLLTPRLKYQPQGANVSLHAQIFAEPDY